MNLDDKFFIVVASLRKSVTFMHGGSVMEIAKADLRIGESKELQDFLEKSEVGNYLHLLNLVIIRVSNRR